METSLTSVEMEYRKTDPAHRKYTKKLTNYIETLIEEGRLFEAKHFFDILCKRNPTHAITVKIGYTLGILLFDMEEVKKYDKLLLESKPLSIDFFWLRLKYFYSINHLEGIEESCIALLSKNTKQEHLSTIIEVCIKQGSYEITCRLANYLQKKKLTLEKLGNEELKKITITKLIKCIKRINNG